MDNQTYADGHGIEQDITTADMDNTFTDHIPGIGGEITSFDQAEEARAHDQDDAIGHHALQFEPVEGDGGLIGSMQPIHIRTTSVGADGNLVEIVGPVMLQRQRGKEQVALARFSRQGGARTQLYVQINEEHGDVYTLTLYFPARTAEEAALIESLQEGERIRAVGQLSSRETYDPRFVTDDAPLGRPMRELAIAVLRIERASEDDIDGSWVELRGTIATPPRLRRHEVESSLEIARTSLLVQVQQPSRRPSVAALRMKEDRVPIDVPVALPGAGAAMARDNAVRVMGWLEVYRAKLNLEREPLVADAISALEAQWAAERERLTGKALQDAERVHTRRLRSLLYEDRLRVRVGQVELVVGTEVNDLEVVRNNHRTWEDSVRTRREAQRTKRGQHAVVAAAPAVEGELTLRETPETDVSQTSGAINLHSGTVSGTRHRKRGDRSLEPGAVVGVD
ncbi:MAG: hypothetical protein M3R24_39770 [Chloroflexota bacterium]|nr:hypothetical protein [Chloroflexota bacterium]